MPKKKARRKKTKWTKKKLDVLYECWKSADTHKERLELIEQYLPKIPPLAALNKMRAMVKTDVKWAKMATRKKNQKEKEKESIRKAKVARKKEVERKKLEIEKRKQMREEKRAKKKQRKERKVIKNSIRDLLMRDDLEKISEAIEPEFFFCSDMQQFVNNISCIFRVFSNDYGLVVGKCEKCKKMNKYISVLEEVVQNARQKRSKSNKTRKGRGKAKEQTVKTKATKTTKSKSGSRGRPRRKS
jgi:hypothetical protein